MAKDAFNRNGGGDGSQSNKNAKQTNKAIPQQSKKPSETDTQNSTSNTTHSSPQSKRTPFSNQMKNGGKKALTQGKSIGKNMVKNKLRQSDSVSGKAYRAYEKTKKLIVRAKRYTSWLIKYVQFCVSNPIGWCCGVITIAIIVGIIIDIGSSFASSDNSGELTTVVLMDCPLEKEGSSDGKTHSASASGADWTREGTTAYKNAKDVFDAWVNAGLSGEAAAGIVGWVASEGNFDIIGRAEGHYGGGLSNSIAHGAVPRPVGTGYSVGGGGIYQFTPYTKYAPLNDPKWEDGKAMTEFVINELPGNWIPNPNDMTGGNHSFEQFAQETDTTQATLMWNSYERGNPAYFSKEHKQADATRANEVFNKDHHKFDRSKYEKNFGKGKTSGGSSSSSSDSTTKDKCKPRESGGNGWQGKGGKHNYSDGQGWKPSTLPEDLKQYAIDPTTVGMKYGSSEGWDPIKPHSIMHDQCTGLSATLGHWLWEKNGKHPTQLQGNGQEVAGNWASTYGGHTSNTPVSGAILSYRNSGAYGHTAMVSHVFDDDSILIIEQNCPNLSGQGDNAPFTWNYRIISKAAYERQNFAFYNPGDNGFTVNPKAKSL